MMAAVAFRVNPLGAQEADVEGHWAGTVHVVGQELPFTVDFTGTGEELKATMDIEVQNAFGLPLLNVSATGGRVHFELQGGPGLAVWDGAVDGDAAEGEFTQAGARGTFTMSRGAAAEAAGETAEAEHVPYREEELSFENGAVHLEGTLTLPPTGGPFPAVVMITGSGAQNRDEELLGLRPFRVIADHLTRAGIAVFRYDDRGVGGSTGNVSLSTTSDFADDALAAVATLAARPEIDAAHIGLIGHSEGGVVAPLAATRSSSVSFIVLIAGTAVPGADVIYEQLAAVARASGASEEDIADGLALQRRLFEALERGESLEPLRAEIEARAREQIAQAPEENRAAIADVDQFIKTQVSNQLTAIQTPWYRYFLAYDPAVALRQVRVPVLALFGELDVQVTVAQNRDPMAEALSGDPDVTIEVFPKANHLFQQATTGSPAEYATLDKAFVPGFLDTIADWILERTKTSSR